MQALVLGFANLELQSAWTREDESGTTHVVCAKDCGQRVGLVGDDLAPVDQSHALRAWLGGHRILYLEPQLSHRRRCGHVVEMDAALDLAGRR